MIMIYLGASFNIYFKWMGTKKKKKQKMKSSLVNHKKHEK